MSMKRPMSMSQVASKLNMRFAQKSNSLHATSFDDRILVSSGGLLVVSISEEKVVNYTVSDSPLGSKLVEEGFEGESVLSKQFDSFIDIVDHVSEHSAFM